MINEIYLHLLGRLEHADACTERRCVQKCDVAAFLASLEQPLLLTDMRRAEQEQRRLTALARGEIPLAGVSA